MGWEEEHEAWEDSRRDADMEMAEMEQTGKKITQLEALNLCWHGSSVAYRNPPVYKKQENLKPGQVACWDCDYVADTEQDFWAEQERMLNS